MLTAYHARLSRVMGAVSRLVGNFVGWCPSLDRGASTRGNQGGVEMPQDRLSVSLIKKTPKALRGSLRGLADYFFRAGLFAVEREAGAFFVFDLALSFGVGFSDFFAFAFFSGSGSAISICFTIGTRRTTDSLSFSFTTGAPRAARPRRPASSHFNTFTLPLLVTAMTLSSE